jgi:hypothetical protein
MSADSLPPALRIRWIPYLSLQLGVAALTAPALASLVRDAFADFWGTLVGAFLFTLLVSIPIWALLSIRRVGPGKYLIQKLKESGFREPRSVRISDEMRDALEILLGPEIRLSSSELLATTYTRRHVTFWRLSAGSPERLLNCEWTAVSSVEPMITSTRYTRQRAVGLQLGDNENSVTLPLTFQEIGRVWARPISTPEFTREMSRIRSRIADASSAPV